MTASRQRESRTIVNGRAEQIWGCGDLGLLFGPGAVGTTPWPRGDKTKKGPTYDREQIRALLSQPVDLEELDPRALRCSQSGLVRHHVDYYGTGRWELTGRTSADHLVELNRFPVIVRAESGYDVIVSGHHRSAAALIAGRTVLARRAATSAFHVTPLLRVCPATGRRSVDAPAALRAGRGATVQSIADGALALRAAGVSSADSELAISYAAGRRS